MTSNPSRRRRLRPVATTALGLLAMTMPGCLADPATHEPDSGATSDTAGTSAGVSVLTQGGSFQGVNGIHFGPDGLLYLASVVTPAVAAVHPETGEIVHRWGRNDGPTSPDDLAFDADGAVYWTDISDGTIGRRTKEGESSVIANLGPGVNPITFSDDGRLFVSQCFMGTHLFEVDPAGVEEPRLIRDDLGPGCGLNGMDWSSAEGRLYGPRWFQGTVVSVDVETGEHETEATGFGVPAAVKFDSKGRLHVLDALRGEVVRVSRDGTKEIVGTLSPGLDNLAFDENDRLFVSSFADGFIVEVTSPDSHRIVLEGGLNMPGGLTLAGSDHESLVVADFFALRTLDRRSGDETSAVRDVIGFSDLGSVMSAHADGQRLVLSSWFDNAVRLWSLEENALIEAFTDFQLPIDALDHNGRIAVSEWGSGSVVSFSADQPDERSVIASELDGPAGLATDGGDLFVAERGGGRVLQIASSDPAVNLPRIVATDLRGPEGLAVSEGVLYVVEADARTVTAVHLADGSRRTIADSLELHVPASGSFPTTMLLNGIAVSGSTAYVSGDSANRIYEIQIESR